jgi:hypothetical protein
MIYHHQKSTVTAMSIKYLISIDVQMYREGASIYSPLSRHMAQKKKRMKLEYD